MTKFPNSKTNFHEIYLPSSSLKLPVLLVLNQTLQKRGEKLILVFDHSVLLNLKLMHKSKTNPVSIKAITKIEN